MVRITTVRRLAVRSDMASSLIGARTGPGEEWVWSYAAQPKARCTNVTRRDRLLALLLAALLALAT